MKKRLSILLAAFIVLTATAYGLADLKGYSYPFVGKWQPAEHPMLADDYGYQDIQNLRKEGKHLRGVLGHTSLNSTALVTNTVILNGWHFRKDQPQESHVIVYAANSFTPASAVLGISTVAIPNTGNFGSTDTANTASIARFSTAPNGSMVICNGDSTHIWGGNEMYPTMVVSASSTVGYVVSDAVDMTTIVTSAASGNNETVTVSVPSSQHILVGSTRQLQGVKFYISSANTQTSTMTGQYWDGTTWSSLSLTDGTSVGGKTLAKTGLVSWTYQENYAFQRYLTGLSLYWYQFHYSAGGATLYQVTVDAPKQSIRNVWDGGLQYPARVLLYDGSGYLDYTDNVIDDDVTNTYMDVGGLTTAKYLLLGFIEKQQGVEFKMVTASENTLTGTGMTASYWNGNARVAYSAFNDGTAAGTKSLYQSGFATWLGNRGVTEVTQSFGDETPLYYTKISFAGTLGSTTKIGEIRGIPYPPNLPTYRFSAEFQNRLFLCGQNNAKKNVCQYSVANVPDIFNGTDSGELTFGDNTELTAAAVVYNVFRTTGYDQLIVTKKNETYRVTGDSPDNWISQKMSGNIGCVAPLSMVTTEAVRMSEDMYRNVAIWVSDKGVVASDGAVINYISDEIKHYWDATNSAFIPVSMQSRSVGWYDPLLNSYKLLIASGAGATYLNTELEYNLKTKEWTKIYRTNAAGANPLQSGWQVFDTNGLGYTYGGGKDGFMYRLENGYTFAGSPIQQYVWTKDILLGGDMLLHTTPTYFRLAFKTKTATAGEEINIAHYGDAVLTTSGSNGQYVPAAMSMASGPYRTSDCVLGPHQMHSFKITATTSTVYNGMELLGMSLFYDPSKTISQ